MQLKCLLYFGFDEYKNIMCQFQVVKHQIHFLKVFNQMKVVILQHVI